MTVVAAAARSVRRLLCPPTALSGVLLATLPMATALAQTASTPNATSANVSTSTPATLPKATPGASPAAVTPSAGNAPSTPATPASWADTITLNEQLEGGIVANPARPTDGENFGDIYTDHANQAQLNQILVTLTRATDPNAKGYDAGFDLQLLYGSDMRANHYLGQFDHLIGSRYQLGVVQADILLHTPWLGSGGTDWKFGEWPSIMGLEVLDPSVNPFYTHSFIYNWGVTFYNTGILGETHVNPTVDIYYAIDSGNTTTLGGGDNNGAPAGYLGLGLNNLFHGKVTELATFDIGPEQSCRSDPNCNTDRRYIADFLTTGKITDKLTSNTELNYIRDEYYRGEAYGFAQYFSYPLSHAVTFNMRGEVWRDNTGDFVVNLPSDLGFVQSEGGFATPVIAETGRTTFSELTLGVTYKPDVPKPIKTLMIRPEIRYERALNGQPTFNAGRDVDAFTFGGDVILGF